MSRLQKLDHVKKELERGKKNPEWTKRKLECGPNRVTSTSIGLRRPQTASLISDLSGGVSGEKLVTRAKHIMSPPEVKVVPSAGSGVWWCPAFP